jgi:hypothetical protein
VPGFARAWRPLAIAAAVAGCGASNSVGIFGEGGELDGGDLGSVTVVSGSTATEEGPAGTDTSAGPGTTGAVDGSDDGIKLDVAAGDLGNASCIEGGCFCTAVDILFVIDNSPSMGPYQEQLAFAFPTFVDAMWANLPDGTDLHVGITTTSFFSGSCAESTMNCATAQTPQEVLDHYITPDVMSTGVNGEQGRLFEHDGKRYYEATVGGDPWPLKIWFSEAAVSAGEVGCSYEMMAAGAAYPFHAANAMHNAGFLRDDGSVLVIFFLTDEPDKSPEGVQTYVDMVAAAKPVCGGLDCAIAAGIVETCIMGVDNVLWQFLQSFPDPPMVGSIDDPAGYEDVIGGALAQVIAQTCDDIVPEG